MNPPTTNLQPGSTGPAVTQLQQYLLSKGLLTQADINTGPGIYGPKTTAAVQKLQQQLGVDNSSGVGYWGPRTIQAIQSQSGTSTGNGSSTTTSSNSAPSVPDLYASLVSSNPFLSDQLNDPTKKAQFDALPDDLKGIYLQTASSLGKAVESGKVVNPNIQLTPADNQKLLDQATSELDPYYQEQLGFLKSDFQTSIGRLMQDYNTGVGRAQDTFKQTLDTNSENAAENGTTYSSTRNQQEGRTVQLQNNALNDALTSAQRNAQDAETNYERTAGSDAVRSLGGIPNLTNYTANNTGSFLATGSADAYTPLGTSTIGSLNKDRTVDINNRQSQLASDLQSNRILDLSTLS